MFFSFEMMKSNTDQNLASTVDVSTLMLFSKHQFTESSMWEDLLS
jgi:hypothetical protein